MRLVALLVALALVTCSWAQTTITPTTTLAAETANNTSTADTYTADTSGNLGASNISKLDVRTLLYSGATTPVYVHFMGWFGTTSHINVGYTSWDAAQVHRQVDDMLSRGVTGAILDWYGPNKWTEESTAKLLKAEAETRNGQFLFALTEDKGALKTCAATTGCDVTQLLISDLTYAYNNYETSPAYMQVNGRPLVFFFDVDQFAINWDLVVASVPGNPLFIYRNSGGFTKPYSAGSYAWVGFPDSNSDWGKTYLDNFYNTSLSYGALHTFGSGYKGFNDTLASWGKNRIVPQDCGHTWTSSLAEIGNYYSNAKQLDFIQLATWNDYEEGTALEMGIDNCVSVTGSISGNSLSWSLTGDESTVDHYTVFLSTDGQNLMRLQDLPAGTHALDLTSYGLAAGNYTLFVKATGKPFLKNQMSAAVSFAVAPPPPAPAPSPDFALGIAPASLTLVHGQSGALSLSVTPQGGFSGTVAFSCANLPPLATCSFSPSSVTPSGTARAATMTLATAGGIVAQRRRPALMLAFWVPGIGLALAGGVRSRRRTALLLLLLLALVVLQMNCGGGTTTLPEPSRTPGTPLGTYTVTVNATSGTLTHAVTATLTVQ